MAKDEWLDLAIMGLGAGMVGTVTGYVRNILPSVSEDIGGLIAGGLMYMYGDRIHPYVQVFGAGVLISSIGAITKGIVPAIGGGGSNPSNPEKGSTSTSLEALAQAEAQKVVA